MAAKICFVLLVLCVVVSAGSAQHIAQKANNISCFVGEKWHAHRDFFLLNGRLCECKNGRHLCKMTRVEPTPWPSRKGTPSPVCKYKRQYFFRRQVPYLKDGQCTCDDGGIITCWTEPGSCTLYGPLIKHGKTFDNYIGIDKVSGFHRTDTCTCENEKITCKVRDSDCYYDGVYSKHMSTYEYTSPHFKDKEVVCSCINSVVDCKPQTPQPPTQPPPPTGKLSIICKYKDQDFLRSLVPYMNDGRCACDDGGIITCWTEPGSCVRYGVPFKDGETFEEYQYIDTITGFNRTDTCKCENEEVICKWKSSDCYYNGVYSKHMSSYIFTSYYPEVRKFDCTCTNSVVKCEKLGDCFINDYWIKNGESERKHIGFDTKSRMNRTEICTCTQGELNCIEELGSCLSNGRPIKHGETFDKYIGIDKISGSHRTDTCTCENEKITCKVKDSDCYYNGVYSKHMSTYEFTTFDFQVRKFVCSCVNSVVECKEFGYYCFINGDWIKNGEAVRKYIGFDIKSRTNRTEICTCIQGQLNCIMVPGSCLSNRRPIKHGETFEEYKGIDKISGFDRTDTCTCENEKIICKWEDAPCLHSGRYYKHGTEITTDTVYSITKCLCNNTKMTCKQVSTMQIG